MNCIHCGHPLPEGAVFCGKCGKKQVQGSEGVPAKKSPVFLLVALCGGMALVTAVVVVLMLALFGLLGGRGPQSIPESTGSVVQTRPDNVTVTEDHVTQGSDDVVPEVTDPTVESEDPAPSEDATPQESTGAEDDPVVDRTNIVDCISCGGSGDCVACEGKKYCPYCKGTGVEACFVCWGTDLCDQCMGSGKTTRGEKCRGCNGKGKCTFDTCTGGYEPCWQCNGQKPCYLCDGDGECLTCDGEGSYDLNGPIQTLTAYRKVEHDDCWYGKTRCEGSACNEGACAYLDCNGTGKLACTSCKGSDECQVCTNNPRYDDRTCRSCDDSGECAQCDGGYDPCYMCEGSGKCSTCNGVFEKDDRMCIDGYTFEEYRYTIGAEQGGGSGSGQEHTKPVSPNGDCTKCGGDGWWCTRCDGTGDCSNFDCLFGDITCTKCNGAKSCDNCWLWTDRTKRCTACGNTRDCNKCDGEGEWECPTCKGSGDCPTCKGDYWCDRCDGSGFAS